MFIWRFLREKTKIAVDKAGETNQNQQRGGKKGHDKLHGILEVKSPGHDADAVNQQNYGGNQDSDIFKPDKICCHEQPLYNCICEGVKRPNF
jgi:hypothetical protein